MKSEKQSPITLEMALYSLAFILALGIRLLNLDVAPLSDHEAVYAIRALELAQGQTVDLTPQPVYILLTGLLFTFFVDTNGTARFIPALVGSLLVFLPLFFGDLRRSSSTMRYAGLILAFGLALDPALVGLSRTAGGPMLALVLSFLAIGLAWQGNAPGTGILIGLALLSGPDLVLGILGIGIAGIVSRFFLRAEIGQVATVARPSENIRRRDFWLRTLAYTAGVILGLGLLWLRLPQGLAGLANLIPLHLSGWAHSSGIPALRLPAAILLYQPLVVLFSLIAAVRVWVRPLAGNHPEDALARWISLWAISALIPAWFYPSRQVPDAIWAVVPLWMLAAMELSRYMPERTLKGFRLPALGLAGLICLLLIMISYNLLRLNHLQAQPILYVAIIGGLVLMTGIVVALVALGWHPAVAITGSVWGITVLLIGYMLSAMWGMSQIRANQPEELWTVGTGPGLSQYLLETINDLSHWQAGMYRAIDVAVNVRSPALQWELRNFPEVQYLHTLSEDLYAAVILTEPDAFPSGLSGRYRGMELVWRRLPAWQGITPPDLLRWLAFREAPVAFESIQLHARRDLFPDQFSLDSVIIPENEP